MSSWEDIFQATSVPKWLYDFDQDPLEAVNAALWGNYYFANLNVAEPSEILIDWALGIDKQNDFIKRLDDAMTLWIQKTWGYYSEGKGRSTSSRTALAWTRLTEVVANVDSLRMSGQALRQRFDERDIYLAPLSHGPSRDPLGKYLYAVARHQTDHSLLPIWWNYCDLIVGIPWHHGMYGIGGLRGLPPLSPADRGRFPEYIAIGLVRLGIGLYERSLNRSLSKPEAKAEFYRAAHIALMAYPFPERWRKYWREQITVGHVPEDVKKWMEGILPEIAKEKPSNQKAVMRTDQFIKWKEEALRIADSLHRSPTRAIPDAERLLKDERIYTAQTGNSHNLCRTLVKFGQLLARRHPKQAILWAEEARLWEPWNSYCWSLLIRATRFNNNRETNSLDIAWEALARFPDNAFIRSEVARTLKDSGNILESEALYRDTVELFPEDVVVRSELAEVLIKVGKMEEAETLYRETIESFPNDVFVRSQLAEILKKTGKLHEAEAVYREAMKLFPSNAVVRSGLAHVLIEADKLEEAEALLRETIELFSEDVVVRSELAEMLKKAGKLGEAEEIYLEAVQLFPNDVIARVGLAEVLIEADKLTEAEKVYRTALALFPNDVHTKTRLARLLRLRGEDLQSEPLELLDEALSIDGTNVDALLEKARLLEEFGIMDEASKLYEKAKSAASYAPDITIAQATVESQGYLKNSLERTNLFIDRKAIMALSCYARFLRRWARQNEFHHRKPEPSDLRGNAVKILNELLQTQPHNPRARAEMGLLFIESKDFQKAEEFLNESVNLLPGDAGLRFALARVKREIAKHQKRPFDHSRPEIVTAEWNQLHIINPDLHPLEHLGKGRTWLAHSDGNFINAQALRSFKSIREWMRPHLHFIDNEHASLRDDPTSIKHMYEQQKGFEEWWCLELQAYLFGPISVNLELEQSHLDVITSRLELYALPIDALEEDFALRMTMR